MWVPLNLPSKIYVVEIRNDADRKRAFGQYLVVWALAALTSLGLFLMAATKDLWATLLAVLACICWAISCHGWNYMRAVVKGRAAQAGKPPSEADES